VELFPNFVRQERGGLSVWFDRKYAAPSEFELFADADRLFERAECELVKDQKKIKVARIRLSLGGHAHAIYLKRYNTFSWRVKLASLFAPSGAVRSLRGAAILLNAQVSTAMPVAVVESRRWGVLTKSFFFSEEIEGGKTADSYWCGDLLALKGNQGYHRRRGFLEELALLFKSLHQRGIYHNDLKDSISSWSRTARLPANHFFFSTSRVYADTTSSAKDVGSKISSSSTARSDDMLGERPNFISSSAIWARLS